ncbi:hypothetical protein MMC13_002234 [Lambiella insularis]|nr:hypothetical protein [Lambiella insularis]
MKRRRNISGLSPGLPISESENEQRPLLGDEEEADEEGYFPSQWTIDQPEPSNTTAKLPVYDTIYSIRRQIITTIDDPYSLEQLRSPRVNISIVRPLVDRLYDMQDISIVYCLLVNKVQFLREQVYRAHHQSVNATRALLCELLANRILRRFDEDNPGAKGVLFLANVLVAGFNAFQGAPEEVQRENHRSIPWLGQRLGGPQGKMTALELAIISESKFLLSSAAAQKVVDAIYEGRVVYTPSSFMDILPDHYKQKPIALYDPREGPLLNQYRLVVPRTRNILEVCQFVVLLVLYFLVMETRDACTFSLMEGAFCIYALGWALDQFASMLEHGWQVYTQNLWSFLDVGFIAIYFLYLIFRVRGLISGDAWFNVQALDILSVAAPVLVPRLGFNLMSENMLFVSLRAMVANFALLSFLSVWCFAGFLLAMRWLSDDLHSPLTIAKWMLWVWFGLDATGIQRSVDFHWLLGPILMVTFAFLGNTLFLTILVSMLTNTFSNIVSNANAEVQFRRAVLTFEGVKSDAIFAYLPPFNIGALVILLPLKFVVSPRWFHKVNVAIVRTLNAPLLLAIGFYERKHLWAVANRKMSRQSKARKASFWDFSRFTAHGDIEAVFENEPAPHSAYWIPAEGQDLTTTVFKDAFSVEDHLRQELVESPGGTNLRNKNRKDSVEPFAGLAEHLPNILHQFSQSGESKSRLEELEGSTRRIEAMVQKLYESMVNNNSETSG